MKSVSKLLRKIIRLQREEALIPPGSSILIAFSGGIDSVVLTHALLQLKSFLKLKSIAVAHFNHMLRKNSLQDEEFAKDFAVKNGIEIFIGREKVGEIAKKSGRNVEETARDLRYSFLRSLKSEKGYDLIATGHHLSDLVETVLLWLIRGAGFEGLLGFEPKEGDVVRPLYRVTRQEIENYAKAYKLQWIEDPTNRDLRFYRNRLRHEVIPILRELNPSVEETFLRMREILKEENDLLHRISSDLLKQLKVGDCLKARDLGKEHTALQRRILMEFSRVKSFSKIEQMRRLLYKGGQIKLGDGLKVVRKGEYLCLKKVE